MHPVISLKDVHKNYGFNQKALCGLDLEIEAGRFVGLFGPNGAGKTTTLKILMNLIPPSKGSATVLGCPSRHLGPTQLQRIGYVSENQPLPGWMTLDQLLRYCRPLYPTWDEAVCRELRTLFALPADKHIRDFSRGMHMKAALLSSLSYLPEVVILDEPFSGLDPLSRDQFVEGLMALSAHKPFTLLLSSHDVGEVERLCDTVAFLQAGCLSLSEDTEDLLRRFRRIEAKVSAGLCSASLLVPGMKAPHLDACRLQYIQTHFTDAATETASLQKRCPGATLTAVSPMSLRDIIVHLSGPEGDIA